MALRDFNRTVMLPMRVWDAPTRLFHWAVVALVALSYATSQLHIWNVHLISGYVLLALILFRLAWGFVGSDTARFSRFLASPVRAWHHLATFRQREPDTQVGHNAAGGWWVLVLLALLVVQIATGLFAHSRRGDAAGVLAKYLTPQDGLLARSIHDFTFNLLVAAIGLHVLVVLAYAMVKRHDLVRPMVTGVKRLPATTRQPRMASPALALALAVVVGAAVWLLVTRF